VNLWDLIIHNEISTIAVQVKPYFFIVYYKLTATLAQHYPTTTPMMGKYIYIGNQKLVNVSVFDFEENPIIDSKREQHPSGRCTGKQ